MWSVVFVVVVWMVSLIDSSAQVWFLVGWLTADRYDQNLHQLFAGKIRRTHLKKRSDSVQDSQFITVCKEVSPVTQKRRDLF
jgi:hypothetical protein